MEGARGFWSYVHADDAAVNGKILRLAHDIQQEYEMITTQKIQLFVDKDALDWGSNWRNGIDENLATTAYFIPILTPRFFKSVECRRELHTFTKQAQALGVVDLIMPILYIDVPELHKDSDDELIELVKTFHRKNWTNLRFAVPSSEEYGRAVFEIASDLAGRNKQIDDSNSFAITKKAGSKPQLPPRQASDDDSPGTIDLISNMLDALPQWTETIDTIGVEIKKVGGIFTRGTQKIHQLDKRHATYTERISAMKVVAKELDQPSEDINKLGNLFNSQVYDVDLGIKAMLSQLSSSETTPENISQQQEFLKSLGEIEQSVNFGLDSLEGMLEQMNPLEQMSRDLRKPLKNMRQGLTLMLESREVIKNWTELARPFTS